MILIFSIAMGAEPSFQLKSIAIWATAFFMLNNSFIATVCKQQGFGMTRIRYDTYSLFTYYSADSDYEVTLMTKTTVYYNGLIVWRPPCIYKSSCAIDVEYFPYDAQTCFLKMGSWTYSGFQVRPMVLLRFFFGPLIQGILVFDPIFQKTVCPCRFIFAVCLALFDSTILLYEYQAHQVEIFLCDYYYSLAKILTLSN